LAFAVGALSHYVGDNIGHSEAVNPATGLTFPKLLRKYGPVVTYEEAPIDHVRVEFGFDTAQIARRRFTPERYRRRIGFRVANAALNRALLETYGLRLGDTLGPVRPGAESYRISVHRLMPLFGGAQVIRLRDHLKPERNDEALREYLQAVIAVDQVQQNAVLRHPPGIGAHILELFFHITPRIGPLRVVDIKAPSTRAEDEYIRSLNDSRRVLVSYLTQYGAAPGEVRLANLDLDTGDPVAPGRYWLTDETYARLLDEVTARKAGPMPPDLIRDILVYYANPGSPNSTRRHRDTWKEVNENLKTLRARYPDVAAM
jgi:hypothetical protein